MKYSERSEEWKAQARANDLAVLRICLCDAAIIACAPLLFAYVVVMGK